VKVTVAPAKTRPPSTSALDRPRLLALLEKAWEVPLTLVVAPAGAGKTTLLAQFAHSAAQSGKAVTWYRAESAESEVDVLLAHLERSMRGVIPTLAGDWNDMATAAAALEAEPPGPSVLVIDDLHTLSGTPGEAALEQLIAYLPSWLHVIVAARRSPSFNLSRLRVSGGVLDVGPEALRFRTWEVEDLYRGHYHQELRPEELAELARRTGGWAAGLQLFHLATRDKHACERRTMLASLSRRWPEARAYLTRNILEDLDDELREFLVRTSMLGRMAADWCDELLGANGSEALLAELQYRHLFVSSDDGGSTYRTHEVLRSHLEGLLVERLGEAGARQEYRRAGAVLERGGAPADALRAYYRGEDWLAARRLLEGSAGDIFEGHEAWPEGLPAALADHDAWIGLSGARRCLADGRWQEALAAYRRCEESAPGSLAADIARRERFSLEAWIDPCAAVASDWVGALRRALSGAQLDKFDEARPVDNRAGMLLAAAVAAVLAGDVASALNLFTQAGDSSPASSFLAGCSGLGRAFCAFLLGSAEAAGLLDLANGLLEQVLAPWTGRLFDGLSNGRTGDVLADVISLRQQPGSALTPWAQASLAMLEGCLRVVDRPAGRAVEAFSFAEQTFDTLSAPALADWAAALSRLATTARRSPSSRPRRHGGELEGPSFTGARVLWQRLAEVGPDTPGATLARIRAADRTGAGPPVKLCCFGRFELMVGQRPVDPALVKPKARAILHLLALHAGKAVHRDRLCALAWPGCETYPATHCLHVAISSLRTWLVQEAGPGAAVVIGRVGDGYVLRCGAGLVDLHGYERAVVMGRTARSEGDTKVAADSFALALGTYRGELLPEAGDATWVLDQRERYRVGAAEVAQRLAECLLQLGDPASAIVACETGLSIDRYRDGLWQTLAQAYEAHADAAGAVRARRAYSQVLHEIGAPAYAPASLATLSRR
jgi:DNA-binding SARP family transcriptional activator/tetratricopeptide (TPR) repeat protein